MTKRSYRILELNVRGEVIKASVVYFTQQDEAAVRYAQHLREADIGVEVWQAARFVARLQPSHVLNQ